MEVTVKTTRTVNAKYLIIEAAVRYDEEDIPNNFRKYGDYAR